MAQRMVPCPHCKSPLPEHASFCPYCAQSVRPRRSVKPPSHLWGKALRWGLGVCLALAAVAAVVVPRLPKTYDAYGEVLYTDADGTYQLLLSTVSDRFTPMPEIQEKAELDMEYRMPSRLFINHVETGVNAGPMFMQKVAFISTEFIQSETSPSPMVCSQPEEMSFSPEAARVSLMDYTGRSEPAELVWTLRMKNRDTIRLRQKIQLQPIRTYDYYPEDFPMETTQQLQDLVDRLSEEIPLPDIVNLHLPPVTYEGGLFIKSRPFNLYGSTDQQGHRTTFTDTVAIHTPNEPITYFYDLDFVGNGDNIGLSSPSRLWAENCTFSNWKTGVMGYGSAWVNVIGCRFSGNQVGFHFNSTGNSVSHTMFNDNHFEENATAVLLENVPTDVTMNFQNSRFSGNRVDIDNRCGQPLDLTQAIFE